MNLLTRKICWQKTNLLTREICWQNLLTKSNLLTTKKPGRLDASKPYLKTSHHASQAMAGAHIPSEKFYACICAWAWPSRKVRQYVVNCEWGNIRAGRRSNHFPFHIWLAQNWIGQRDYLAADVCKKIAHSPRKLLRDKIALWAKICSINLLTENQIC